MDKNKDDELNKISEDENFEKNQEPIDGQIGIEELYVRREEKDEEILKEINPIENQLSFDDITKQEQIEIKNFLNEQKVDNNLDDRKELDDFFKTDRQIKKEQKQLREKENLNKFFEEEKGNIMEENKDKTNKNTSNKNNIKKEGSVVSSSKTSNKIPLKIKTQKAKNIGTENKTNELEKNNEIDKTENTDKTKKRKTLIEEESFFVNQDNSQMINDIDKINSEIGEVNVSVGKDAFSDYAKDTIETEGIQEKENVDIKEKVISENSGEDVVDGMLYKNLDTVLHESMIPYSEHVILDRAIPRVEDGLKPVQRRILYSMIELGVTPDKPFRKSARIVGDCLGKYHPHGDSSVYDAMVRLAQPFNTNMILVEGHGNFGSVDGDSAAAMRYTEARLAPLALELLRDLDKNTVRWGLNFDDTLKEPEILPGRFPNLLVNGSTGIAVGLATNIPPHNLAETIDGVVAYIDNPNITLKEMLKIIKGPDFPTGGYILNSSEINEAYSTGRGKIYIRAKMHIETNNADKKYIVITELPYQVNKAALLQRINGYREEDKYGFGVISEVRDESDREGLRAVIRLKKDANVKEVYESLLKNTELQTTFGVNMVAIANGKPKQMGLLDIISYYTEYQREIILRRSKYDCEQAKEREHILSGLLIAIKNIDAVVKIIKTSKNTTEAKARLKEKFYLSDRQAQAILDMRLARLTSLEVFKLEEEIKELQALIKKLTIIINSKKEQLKVVKEEILQIKKNHKVDRRTKILKTDDTLKIAEEESTPKEPVLQKVVIVKNAQNNFKCVSLKQYNLSNKEFNENSTLYDCYTLKFETENNKTLLAFSNFGNCFKVEVKDFGENRFKDKGTAEKTIFKELKNGETIVALFDFEETSLQNNLLFLTKFGMIKKTAFSEYNLLKKYYQAMKLKENDEILSIVKEQTDYNYVFVTKLGMVLKADNSDVPLQGRVSGGVKGVSFGSGDYCVLATISNDEGEVFAITDKGNSKRVLLTNIDKMARYRKGLKLFNLLSDTGKKVIFASVVKNPYTIVTVSEDGNLYYKSTDLVPIETRIGKGKVFDKSKKNMNLQKAIYNVCE